MNQFDKRTKEQLRGWLMQRQACRAPLPDIEAIRRDLSRLSTVTGRSGGYETQTCAIKEIADV